MPSAAQPRAAGSPSGVWDVAAIVLFTLFSRAAFIPRIVMGPDGPDYINGMKFDSTYSVPMPGHIGSIALARFFTLFTSNPAVAFGLAGTVVSTVGALYTLLLFRLIFPRWLALAAAFAVVTNTMIWYHGVILESYIVWFGAMPTIGYYGLRLVRERSTRALVFASLATGLWTIMRPDLVLFGGPLLGAAMLVAWKDTGWSKQKLYWWPLAAAICAACCCLWFFPTAHILGGVDVFLQRVKEKDAYHQTLGAEHKGLIEGLMRNSVKFALFLGWGVHIAIFPALVGIWIYLRRAGTHHRAWMLAAAWLAPSAAFCAYSFVNAGLTFPLTPLLYAAAAVGAGAIAGVRKAVCIMAALAAINTAQFTLSPIMELKDQRAALMNHMFLGYTGTGIRKRYTYLLDDFGMDKSLKNTVKQFLKPEPLPIPPAPKSPAAAEPKP